MTFAEFKLRVLNSYFEENGEGRDNPILFLALPTMKTKMFELYMKHDSDIERVLNDVKTIVEEASPVYLCFASFALATKKAREVGDIGGVKDSEEFESMPSITMVFESHNNLENCVTIFKKEADNRYSFADSISCPPDAPYLFLK